MRHYVFGYGSLICAESRAITASTLGGTYSGNSGAIIPVRVNRCMRQWNVRGQNITYLGVQRFTDTGIDLKMNDSRNYPSCVGVLIPLPDSSNDNNYNDEEEVLLALDRREINYNRVLVDLCDIERVDDLLLPQEEKQDENNNDVNNDIINVDQRERQKQKQRVEEIIEERYYENTFLRRRLVDVIYYNNNHDDVCVWIYVPREFCTKMAHQKYPILQSYVDIALRGCLSISKSFTKEFVEGTYGWYPGHRFSYSTSCSLHDDIPSSSDPYKGKNNNSNDVNDNESCWINDRKNPFYVRADKKFSLENSDKLDECLVLPAETSSLLSHRTTISNG